MPRRKTAGLLIAALAAVIGLAACGGSGGGSSGSSSKVLKIWWYEGSGSAYQIAWDQAIKDFKKQHPGVQVQFSLKSFDQMQQNASMILNSSDVPDVMEYNKGDATTGLLSKEGLLTDLTAEAQKYGWDKELGSDLQVTSRYSPKGVMGSGDWYGVSDYAEYLTVYYNKPMFAKYGLTVPTTMAQLTADMNVFVKHGVTPFANAGDDYIAMQYLYTMELAQSTPQQVQDYERYTGAVDFHDAAWTNAVKMFQNWVSKGYIAKNSVSLTATQAGNDFETGKNPMLLSGNWWAGTFESDIKSFDWGTFLWPGNTLDAGSGGNLFVVPKNAASKQLAYDFISDTLQPDVQRLLANNGAVPVSASTAGVTNPLNAQMIANFATLEKSSGLAYYPDWPTPSFYNLLLAQTQDLINGANGNSVLSTLQSSYNQYVSSVAG
jgi:raffinose/stachyose/melibiose transport system substrate-binding protein